MVVVRKSYYIISILTNKRNGTLYTGMTGEMKRRIWQHQNGYYSGFSNWIASVPLRKRDYAVTGRRSSSQ